MVQESIPLLIFLIFIACIPKFIFSDEAIREAILERRAENQDSSVLAQEPYKKSGSRLSKPLIGSDGRIYTCSEKSFFSFESNGKIAWDIPLDYACHTDIAPLQDEAGKLYLVAEDRVLKIKPLNIGTGEPVAEVLFGPETKTGGSGEIIGLAISIWSSSLFISIKNRGLFAYTLYGHILWSAGPMLYQFSYRQGCKENVTVCFFTSAPAIDNCEGSLYISNSEGQLYSLSLQSPHFNWIHDFSSLDKLFTITPGNNGRLYLTFPRKALVMALDVSIGNVMWQHSVGPLSTHECSLLVDSNGWASIGSLDGSLYSFSPTGNMNKLLKATELDLVQVSPLLDCSGSAVYVSQTRMETKITHTIGEYTYISASKPINVLFTMLVPATGAVYWTGEYPGQFSSLLFGSDLQQFMVDERILLAFVTSAKMGKPLQCHTTRQKLAWSCSQAKPRHLNIYTGNEKTILFFLLFQFVVLIILAASVRFCYIFWGKKKVKDQDLGKFLEKRRSLHMKKKAFSRAISELEQKVVEDVVANEVLEKLGGMVKEREGIERKLSTTYSLGRDRDGSKSGFQSRSLLPMYNGRAKRHSFQSSKKENVTIFHTLSDSSSGVRSISSSSSSSSRSSSESTSNVGEKKYYGSGDMMSAIKGKAPMDTGLSNSALMCKDEPWESSPGSASGSKGYANPLFVECPLEDEPIRMHTQGQQESWVEPKQVGLSRNVMKRRRSMCSN